MLHQVRSVIIIPTVGLQVAVLAAFPIPLATSHLLRPKDKPATANT